MPIVLTTAPEAVRLGGPARGLEPGEFVDLDAGRVRITAVRAEHGPPGPARAAALRSEAIIVPIHKEGWAHFSSPPSALAAAFSEARLSDRLQLSLPEDDVAIGACQS